MSLNIYTEVGLVTLMGLISKHGILIVQFANQLQQQGRTKREAIEQAAGIRLRPILMTTAAMVLGVVPLIIATGAGAVSRFQMGVVIASGLAIGTLFTLFVVPAVYIMFAADHHSTHPPDDDVGSGAARRRVNGYRRPCIHRHGYCRCVPLRYKCTDFSWIKRLRANTVSLRSYGAEAACETRCRLLLMLGSHIDVVKALDAVTRKEAGTDVGASLKGVPGRLSWETCRNRFLRNSECRGDRHRIRTDRRRHSGRHHHRRERVWVQSSRPRYVGLDRAEVCCNSRRRFCAAAQSLSQANSRFVICQDAGSL